ncbi:hypothetical protein C8Q73DRAFT_335061 [Cubamyces lactineus]|nr:hypothetical protein C8Q73DRAFT_335061 [Cubamyces lactineus]
MALHLPYEVTYHILRETQRNALGHMFDDPHGLHRDRRILASCSLVCLSWRLPAQALLFEGLSLAVGSRLVDFLVFLQSTPHAANAIRSLRLQSGTAPDEDEDEDAFNVEVHSGPLWERVQQTSSERLLSPALLMDIVGTLPNLSYLHLDRIVLLGWPEDRSLPSRPVSLRSLNLFVNTYMPLVQPGTKPLDILSFFEVGLLIITGNKDVYGANQHVPPSEVLAISNTNPPTIAELRTYGHDCFLECNLRRGASNVDHLTLNVFDNASDVLFVRSLLEHYGCNATRIHLDVDYTVEREFPEEDVGWQMCNLAACTRLQSLCLSWEMDVLRPDQNHGEVYDAIVGSAPRTLRELKISLSAPHRVTKEVFEPMALCLAPRVVQAVTRFPEIKDIILTVTQVFDYDDCKGMIHDLLPRAIVESPVLKIVIRPSGHPL